MRYFSTSSASVTVTRRKGYYPSCQAARRLAVKLAYVLGDENRPDIVKAIADGLSHGLPFNASGYWAAASVTNAGSTDPVQVLSEIRDDGTFASCPRTREQTRAWWGARMSLLSMSSSEQRMIQELSDWWTADIGDPEVEQKCFIAANLNQGRTLVVIER